MDVLRDAVAAAKHGKETVSLWPHAGGVIQVVTVPSFTGDEFMGTVSVGFSLDAQTAGDVQAPDKQRDRIRGQRPRRRLDAASDEYNDTAAAPGGNSDIHVIHLGDAEYVAVSRALRLQAHGRARRQPPAVR